MVPGLRPAGGRNLSKCTQGYIANYLSIPFSHHSDMTDILLDKSWPIRKSEVLGSIPGQATYFRSADSRGAVVSYWQKYVHEVLVNRLGGLSLP